MVRRVNKFKKFKKLDVGVGVDLVVIGIRQQI